MDRNDFILRLDDLLQLDPGTLKGSDRLDELEAWDSLAVMGFIALADEELGAAISPARLARCQTVDDLVALAHEGAE